MTENMLLHDFTTTSLATFTFFESTCIESMVMIRKLLDCLPVHVQDKFRRMHSSSTNCVILFCVFACLVLNTVEGSKPEILYVMNPFDSIGYGWHTEVYNNVGNINLTLTEQDVAFGKRALLIDYQVQQNESWGGFVSFRSIDDFSTTRHHSCLGATHLSLWYRILQPQSSIGRVHLRLILYDDSDCVTACDNEQNLEVYYSFHYILDADAASDRALTGNASAVKGFEWEELRIELRGDGNAKSPFWRTGWSGTVGNGVLDLDRIKGWRIELSIDSQGGIGSSSSGALVVDQLSCVGGEELFGAAFHLSDSFQEAVKDGTWIEEYYESELSRNLSEAVVSNGTMTLKYTIEQVETWGGLVGYTHMAPGVAYYNISQASKLSFSYEVIRGASQVGRVHLRVILMDSSDCDLNCDFPSGPSYEQYYSFFDILDSDTGGKTGNVGLMLQGSNESTSPLWRTGWAGVVGNNAFDSDTIKGYRVEINMDSQGALGSIVSGVVALRNVTTVMKNGTDTGISNNSTDILSGWVLQPGFMFATHLRDGLRWVEFQGNKCCELCEAELDCLYAQSDGRDCYLVSVLDSDDVQLSTAEFDQSMYATYWTNDTSKRGDFCKRCACHESNRTIDCRGKKLLILPKAFSEKRWKPRLLDLRDNPHLVLLGSGALTTLSDSLEELKLPSSIRHIGLEGIKDLPFLSVVTFEEEEQMKQYDLVNNVITNDWTSFGDVCCGIGAHFDLMSPPEGLTFCDMKYDTPGADSVYEYFVTYDVSPGAPLSVIHPSSSFMSEAAESAEKCAEYCTIRDGCHYFSYDARLKESENTCYLLGTNATKRQVCCNPDDYADAEGTLPGWTSGRVPRTRHTLDDARVRASPQNLVLEQTTGYMTEFVVQLGAMPLRGAVWIEPKLASPTSIDLSFSPSRVVLYDNVTRATITVSVLNVNSIGMQEMIVVNNAIDACDAAFRSFDTFDSENNIYIEILLPPTSHVSIAAMVVPSVFIAILAILLFYVDQRRKRTDSTWTVKMSDLRFDHPPRVIGQGTCGSVLLAEYRGTTVAVKRVIPPAQVSTTISKPLATLEGQDDSDMTEDFLDGIERGYFPKDSPVRSKWFSFDRRHSFRLEAGSFAPWRNFHPNHFSRRKADFIVEMRHLSTLRHPCITTVMGAVIGRNEEPMLIMEYMDHGSLHDLIHNETVIIDAGIILPILRDIVQGVRYLHAAEPQVLHCDLKAQNILVDSRFRAKVADFGLSQKKPRKGAVGTPFWMAPELLRGESSNTAASDVYSFGIILYEVYSRKDPYENENFDEVLQQVADLSVNKRPPIPQACPTEIQYIMTECLKADPRIRPTFQQLDLRLKGLDWSNAEPGETLFSMQAKKVRQTDSLLLEVFPQHVAEALREGRKVQPESRDMVTIFFADIVGFTDIAATLPPIKISDMLDRLYNRFDKLSRQHEVFKVETIGDAYMAVTNLTKEQPDHAKRIVEFSFDAVKAAKETLIDLDNPTRGCVNIRVGVNSGPVVANVVGSRNPRYCLFGDAVNTAARMESNSIANQIHCSESTARLLIEQRPETSLRTRGKIPVKGKGEMRTYWVNENVSRNCLRLSMSEARRQGFQSLRDIHTDRANRSSRRQSMSSVVTSYPSSTEISHENDSQISEMVCAGYKSC